MKKGNPGQRMRWHAIIDRVGPEATEGVELGVFEGTLSRHLLDALPGLTLHMVDRWSAYTPHEIAVTPHSKMPTRPQSYFDEARQRALQAVEPYRGRWIVHAMDTVEAADQVPDGLDFVFVDARHDEEGIRRDIAAWQGKIKPSGWLMGHDYGSDRNHPQVRRVIDELFGSRVEVDADHVWAVQV